MSAVEDVDAWFTDRQELLSSARSLPVRILVLVARPGCAFQASFDVLVDPIRLPAPTLAIVTFPRPRTHLAGSPFDDNESVLAHLSGLLRDGQGRARVGRFEGGVVVVRHRGCGRLPRAKETSTTCGWTSTHVRHRSTGSRHTPPPPKQTHLDNEIKAAARKTDTDTVVGEGVRGRERERAHARPPWWMRHVKERWRVCGCADATWKRQGPERKKDGGRVDPRKHPIRHRHIVHSEFWIGNNPPNASTHANDKIQSIRAT